jgi:hypothetical protein
LHVPSPHIVHKNQGIHDFLIRSRAAKTQGGGCGGLVVLKNTKAAAQEEYTH